MCAVDSILEVEPQNAFALSRKGEIYRLQNNPRAEQCFSRALSLGDKEEKAYCLAGLGEINLRNGKIIQASRYLQNAYRICSTNGWINSNLNEVQKQENNQNQRVPIDLRLLSLSRLFPRCKDEHGWENANRTLKIEGIKEREALAAKYNQLFQQYDQFQREARTNPDAAINAAYIATGLNDFVSSIKCLALAIRFGGTYQYSWYLDQLLEKCNNPIVEAEVFRLKGDYRQALTLLRPMIQNHKTLLQEELPELVNDASNVQIARQPIPLHQFLEHTADLKDQKIPFAKKVITLLKTNKRCREILVGLIRQHPDLLFAISRYALAYADAYARESYLTDGLYGDLYLELALLYQEHVFHQQDPYVLIESAALKMRLKGKEALREVHEAASSFPDDFKALQLLGFCHYLNYNYSEAEQALKKSRELNSKNPDIYFHLAQIALIRKKEEEAFSFLNQALDIKPNHEMSLRMRWELNLRLKKDESDTIIGDLKQLIEMTTVDEYLLYLAEYYLYLKDENNALTYYNQFLDTLDLAYLEEQDYDDSTKQELAARTKENYERVIEGLNTIDFLIY